MRSTFARTVLPNLADRRRPTSDESHPGVHPNSEPVPRDTVFGMDTHLSRQPARDPQDLERLLVARQHAGDVEGMVDLYEPDAVIEVGRGELVRGTADIRLLFAAFVAEGRRFDVGEQRPPIVSGNLAMTSTRLPDGSVTAEVARRQPDGTWLWVIDRFSAV